MPLKITTGFLTGNLFDGWDPAILRDIDEEASVERYAEKYEEALAAAYPDADIDVRYEQAEGELPFPLQTRVYTDNEDFQVEEEIARDVAEIGERVYEDYDLWVVNKT